MTTTRREFLAALTAASGTLLAGCAGTATATGARRYNRVIDAHAYWYPQEFVSLMELERAAKLPGMRAINIGEVGNGKNLHEKKFWPVYERAEAHERQAAG